MENIINLTIRATTLEQQRDGAVDLPARKQEVIKQYMEEALEGSVSSAASGIAVLAIEYCRENKIPTRNRRCLIGGDPLLMAELEHHLWLNRMVPVYSRYKLRAVPEKQVGLWVPEEWKHVGFRRPQKPLWKIKDERKRRERGEDCD